MWPRGTKTMISAKRFTRKLVLGTTLVALGVLVGMLIWTQSGGQPYGQAATEPSTAPNPDGMVGSVLPPGGEAENIAQVPETDRQPVSPATSGTSLPVAFVDKTKLSSAERLRVDQTLTRIIAQFRSELWEKGA